MICWAKTNEIGRRRLGIKRLPNIELGACPTVL